MIYYFYSKNDPKKEQINQIEAINSIEATILFAELKRLTIDKFLDLYNVEQKPNENK